MSRPRIRCKKCGTKCRSESGYCIKCSPYRGRYVRTSEHRSAMSKRQSGKPKPYASYPRPKHSKFMKQWWTTERKEKARQRMILRMEDRDNVLHIALAISGANNPNYQGKNKASGYGPGWGRAYRAKLKQRAKGVCERCHKKRRLDLHHKDFSKDNHSPENIMCICRSCHKSLHFANSVKT